MLTQQQSQLLGFIEGYQSEHGGASPSFEDMKAALSLKSKSGVHRILAGLEERGFIRRMRYRNRAIEVIRHPQRQQDLRQALDRIIDEAQQAHPGAFHALATVRIRVGALLIDASAEKAA